MSLPTRPVVAHVVLGAARGGAEVVAESLAGAAVHDPRARYAAVAALPADAPYADRWRALGIQVISVPPVPRFREWVRGRQVVRALEHAVRSTGADLVHTHGIAAQILGGRAAARAGRAAVWHLHDCRDSGWTANGLLHRRAASTEAAVVIAVSQTVASSWTAHVADGRLAVVHNGVASDVVEPVVLPHRTGPLVVWCGRLQRWKGTHVFLDVAARVRQRHPTARFAIVGGTLFGIEPGYVDALHRQAHAVGVADAVHWVGHVEDARPWLAAADVVVHSSITPEPFGLVIAEAMVQARPVVAFDRGGAAEQIVDGTTGALVPADDVDAMAAAVVRVVTEPRTAKAWGDAARVRATSVFSLDAMVRGVESAYDRARVCG